MPSIIANNYNAPARLIDQATDSIVVRLAQFALSSAAASLRIWPGSAEAAALRQIGLAAALPCRTRDDARADRWMPDPRRRTCDDDERRTA